MGSGRWKKPKMLGTGDEYIKYKERQLLETGEMLSTGYLFLGSSYINSSMGEDLLRPFASFSPISVNVDLPSIDIKVSNGIVKIVKKESESKPSKRALVF